MTTAKILVCYNSPVSIFPVYNGKPVESSISLNDLSESGFSREIARIRKNLQQYFTEVSTFAVNRDVEKAINKINGYAPDVIFNFVESVEGIASYEYCMAGLFELLGYSYTGNYPSCLGNCLNKDRTKKILRSYGINTPASLSLEYKEEINPKTFKLNFPVIIKLMREDASIGISEFSVVNNFSSLKKQLGFLFRTYKQDVIIEEYIDGRELNVAILGDTVLPISEIRFDGLPKGLPRIVTYDGKWMADSVYFDNTKPVCPAKLDRKTKASVEKTALAAFKAINCRDYARVDIRLDKKKIPYVIEVNPNPDISYDSGFARASAAAGLSHPELLFRIASMALSRKTNDTKNKAS